jgi:CHAD domain-containing protein
MPFLTDLQPSSREALTFLRGAERRFQRRLDAAVAAGRPDLLMHEARKSGKRARYVAEMAAPALGGCSRTWPLSSAGNEALADYDADVGLMT